MAKSTRWWGPRVVVLLMTLSIGRAVAQPELRPTDDGREALTEKIDEITVLGTRSMRTLRLEVQAARERVYDLFNSLNSDDEFDIHCRNVPRTGTRIPRAGAAARTCDGRPRDHRASRGARAHPVA
jgi:hypothetical protein